ncbi:MAG TPA: Ig-like domain-containing protein, partial [Gemmatimonadales bacterium]|nr:Ig-like domain-containing protein [Gemmatimonadales bacterium]
MRLPTALSALGLLLLAGCIEQNPLSQTTPPDESVALIPATLFLEPGNGLSVAPTEGLAAGGALSWESSASSVATVSSNGTITALTTGVAEVRAKNSRGTGRTTVTVVSPAPPIRSWRVARQGLTDATLLGLWSVSPQTTFAVGQLGTILRSDDGGATWNRMVTPDSTDLVGVWGASSSDVYAVGVGGTILHFDGAGWSRMASPTNAVLLEVWGLAPD